MAEAQLPMPLEQEEAVGALLEILQKVSKKKFSLIKKKLRDWKVPAGYEQIPERSLQCARRPELAILIIHHYGVQYGVELLQQVLEDVGDHEGSRELREYLEQEGTSFSIWWRWESRFPHLSPNDLAEAGFYYVGPWDRVRCFSCGKRLHNWQPGDVPLTRHLNSFPGCLYAWGKMGIDVGKVGPWQKLFLKDQPVCPEMTEEWNRLATYRSGPWYPGEQLAQSKIMINPQPGGGVHYQGGHIRPEGSLAGSVTYTQGGRIQPQGSFSGGDIYTQGGHIRPEGSFSGGGVHYQGGHIRPEGSFSGGGVHYQGGHIRPEGSLAGSVIYTQGGRIQPQGSFSGGDIYTQGGHIRPEGSFSGGGVHYLGGRIQFEGPFSAFDFIPAIKPPRLRTAKEGGAFAAVGGGASGVQEVASNYRLWETAMECALCGKVPPITHLSSEIHGHMFRAHLPWKGLFRCAETGIQFLINTPALIDFELVSWGNYLKSLQEKSLENVGPLFNIRVLSGQVSAVYLPHYVCLKDRDVDVKKFKIVHYNAKGMTLESPSITEPFYVALENPTFSFIGVVYKVANLFRAKIPAHGAVFIYGRFIKGYTIHLYFMPQDPLVKQAVHKKETANGFFVVDKPPMTRTVYTRKKYLIKGPASAKIDPEDLKLRFDTIPEMYNYSEIYLTSVDKDIILRVTSERDEKMVWNATLRKEELIPGEQKSAGGKHFMDKHRTELIARVSHIDPILDDLLDDEILTQEQYDSVRSNRTSQEKMRQLYDCVRAWGDGEKEELFKAMKKHNQPLISDLKHKSIS
ncbi:uncharacterized protein LOC121398819 isoform X2 [Xenopus laevis]|uniref:Uncharacterized protein LOC121398819 isoform X2 n=1 Tax=Xenopus laevis TaxID=8355 RepID=A0A8J1LZD5_XENLA|nr:uncharacterized protein LOC121398819 isoform X2 [Xenopus laevis]